MRKILGHLAIARIVTLHLVDAVKGKKMEDKEPVWMNHREWYAEDVWYKLSSTLMPREWVIKKFNEKMKEYDERVIQEQ